VTGRLKGSHSEVSKLNIVVPIEKDVLGLQITMTDIESVAIPKGGDYLAEQSNSFFLGERSVVGNVVEQFTSLNVLEDKVSISY
jgi:hypothetical protein